MMSRHANAKASPESVEAVSGAMPKWRGSWHETGRISIERHFQIARDRIPQAMQGIV
jgi:hypothetical protein